MLMMRKIYLLFFISFWINTSKSQDSILLKAAESISSEDLKKIVYTLASPEMGGRGVGTEGIQKAAGYIKEQFQKNGIGYLSKLNGYYQKIDFPSYRLEKPTVKLSGNICNEYIDYLGVLSTISGNKALGIVIVQNTSLENIQGLDLNYKVIMILTRDIFFVKKPLYDLLIKKSCRGVILCNPYNLSEFKDLSKIFALKDGEKKDKFKTSFSGSVVKTDSLLKSLKFKSYYISTLVVSPKVVSRILGVNTKTLIGELDSKVKDSILFRTMQPTIFVKQDILKENQLSNNVLGYIEGSDFKNEVIVISAHYDHLGIEAGNIMFGADDNASGVATVLEIAEAYSIAVKNGFKPRRSIVFAAFTAEEKGLWGSRFFVKSCDSLKIKTTIDLNADMVGRGEDSKIEMNSQIKKLYAITAKNDTSIINRIKSIPLGIDSLNMDYSLVGKNEFLYDSDHGSFIVNKIPAVMFIRGLHSDYHTPRDTPDKLDYTAMERAARLIFRLSMKYTIK